MTRDLAPTPATQPKVISASTYTGTNGVLSREMESHTLRSLNTPWPWPCASITPSIGALNAFNETIVAPFLESPLVIKFEIITFRAC